MFVTTDGALSFCMCVCYDAYCHVCLNFLAHIEPWTDFASLEIEANILAWYRPRIGPAAYIGWAKGAAISSLKKGLRALNTHLASNSFLVGHSMILTDIVTTCKIYVPTHD